MILVKLMSDLLILFSSDQQQSPAIDEVLSGLQMDLLLPYSHLLLSSRAEIPDSCLAFGLRDGPTRWYIFSEANELRQTRTELTALIQVREKHMSHSESLFVYFFFSFFSHHASV